MGGYIENLVARERAEETCRKARELGFKVCPLHTRGGWVFRFYSPRVDRACQGRPRENKQDALLDACSQARADFPELSDA